MQKTNGGERTTLNSVHTGVYEQEMNGHTHIHLTSLNHEDASIKAGEIMAVFNGQVQEHTDQHRPDAKKMYSAIDTMYEHYSKPSSKNSDVQLFEEMTLGEMNQEEKQFLIIVINEEICAFSRSPEVVGSKICPLRKHCHWSPVNF